MRHGKIAALCISLALLTGCQTQPTPKTRIPVPPNHDQANVSNQNGATIAADLAQLISNNYPGNTIISLIGTGAISTALDQALRQRGYYVPVASSQYGLPVVVRSGNIKPDTVTVSLDIYGETISRRSYRITNGQVAQATQLKHQSAGSSLARPQRQPSGQENNKQKRIVWQAPVNIQRNQYVLVLHSMLSEPLETELFRITSELPPQALPLHIVARRLKGKTWHRIATAPLGDRKTAIQLRNQVRQQFPDAWPLSANSL
ncbi:MAG: hypothetical protein ABW162_05125 [Candidatus Sedimenticola sp. PURPLELP]